MKEKYSQEVKGKLVARSAWWVGRPDHWGCESESPVVECQVVWPGGWLKREVIWLMFSPFIALLSTSSSSSSSPPPPSSPTAKKKKTSPENFTVMSFICKTGVLSAGWMCVCMRLWAAVCVCMCCLSGWFHYLKDHYTCLSTAKRPEKN